MPVGTEEITVTVPTGANVMIGAHPAGTVSREDFLELAASVRAKVQTQGEEQGGAAHIYTMSYVPAEYSRVEITVFGPRVDGQDDLPF